MSADVLGHDATQAGVFGRLVFRGSEPKRCAEPALSLAKPRFGPSTSNRSSRPRASGRTESRAARLLEPRGVVRRRARRRRIATAVAAASHTHRVRVGTPRASRTRGASSTTTGRACSECVSARRPHVDPTPSQHRGSAGRGTGRRATRSTRRRAWPAFPRRAPTRRRRTVGVTATINAARMPDTVPGDAPACVPRRDDRRAPRRTRQPPDATTSCASRDGQTARDVNVHSGGCTALFT